MIKGNVYKEKEEHDKAIKCFNKVISIDIEFELAWANKGHLYKLKAWDYEDRECHDKAKEYYDKARECYDKARSFDSVENRLDTVRRVGLD